MQGGGFTLADRLGAKPVPCKVRGCTRTFLQLAGKALALQGRGAAAADGPGAGMCDPCQQKLPTLASQERPCDNPTCTSSWTWTVEAQLEAFAAKRPPPRILCAGCEEKLAALQDKEIPCAAPGCTRTATLSRRQQLVGLTTPPPANDTQLAGDATAESTPGTTGEAMAAGPDGSAAGRRSERPPRGRITTTGALCPPCSDVSSRISDRLVGCGITGCKRKWLWKADEQLSFFVAGKPNEPPRRMCDGCRASFGKLSDREIRCRTSGCKKTFIWSRFDQLDACVADRAPPKAPHLMCESCFQIFAGVSDVERPCRKSGCKNTWTDRRGAQLARAVRGKTGDPYPQYCEEHKKDLIELEDREIGCKTDSCPGTWTWTAQQQLAAGVQPELKEPAGDAEASSSEPATTGAAHHGSPASDAPADVTAAPIVEALAPGASARGKNAGNGRPGKPPRPERRRDKKRRRQIHPPDRLCGACIEFLKDRTTQEIACTQCATPIYWPPESQLQTHLGHWTAPSLCGACKRDATEAARKAAREAIIAAAPKPGLPSAATAAPDNPQE